MKTDELYESGKSYTKHIVIAFILILIIITVRVTRVYEYRYDREKWYSLSDKATDYDEKIRCLSRAIACDKLYAFSYNRRGFVHLQYGHFDKAMKDFDYIIENAPQDVPSHVFRAMTFDSLGNYDAALKDYSIAINLNKEDAYSRYYRASFFHHNKKYSRGLTDIKRALELEPGNTDFLQLQEMLLAGNVAVEGE